MRGATIVVLVVSLVLSSVRPLSAASGSPPLHVQAEVATSGQVAIAAAAIEAHMLELGYYCLSQSITPVEKPSSAGLLEGPLEVIARNHPTLIVKMTNLHNGYVSPSRGNALHCNVYIKVELKGFRDPVQVRNYHIIPEHRAGRFCTYYYESVRKKEGDKCEQDRRWMRLLPDLSKKSYLEVIISAALAGIAIARSRAKARSNPAPAPAPAPAYAPTNLLNSAPACPTLVPDVSPAPVPVLPLPLGKGESRSRSYG